MAARTDELRQRREAQARTAERYRQAVEAEEHRARQRGAEAHRQERATGICSAGERPELRDYLLAVAERTLELKPMPKQTSTPLTASHQWLTWIEERAARIDHRRSCSAGHKPELRVKRSQES
jgi:hypothetical protein